jgi:FtsZ-binding cell division protein ZapB
MATREKKENPLLAIEARLKAIEEEKELLEAENEELRNSKNSFKSKLGASLSRMVNNVVDDPLTTLSGVAAGAGVIYSAYPNLDIQSLAHAFGFVGMGAVSNSKTSNETQNERG